jgi:hypothetical protein
MNAGRTQGPPGVSGQALEAGRAGKSGRCRLLAPSSIVVVVCLAIGATLYGFALLDRPQILLILLAVPPLGALAVLVAGRAPRSLWSFARLTLAIALRLLLDLTILMAAVPWVVVQLLWRVLWVGVAVCALGLLIIIVYHALLLFGIDWQYPAPDMVTLRSFLGFAGGLAITLLLALGCGVLCRDTSSERFFELIADPLFRVFDPLRRRLDDRASSTMASSPGPPAGSDH